MASIFKTALLSSALVGYSYAHMVMQSPVPIGNPTNFPLDNAARNAAANSGAAYPCHTSNLADFQDATVTPMQPGSEYTVSFRGSAVHGGGSCQFSLTKDTAPNSDSIFKVIHSVEGGCPARNITGNFNGDANFEDPSTYPVPIPDDLEPGRYTFAWTWINKVGNREFYMNCAAVEIGASSENAIAAVSTATKRDDDTFFDSLPDMVIVNTADDDCLDVNESLGVSFKYANPGSSIEVNEVIDDQFMVLPQCRAGGGKYTAAGSVASPSSAASPSAVNAVSNVTATSMTSAAGSIPVTNVQVISSPTSAINAVTIAATSSTISFSNGTQSTSFARARKLKARSLTSSTTTSLSDIDQPTNSISVSISTATRPSGIAMPTGQILVINGTDYMINSTVLSANNNNTTTAPVAITLVEVGHNQTAAVAANETVVRRSLSSRHARQFKV